MAISKLNQVEGLDPNKLLTKVTEHDGNQEVTRLFMGYKESQIWFLSVFPEGCMNHEFVQVDKEIAIVTASVYRNQSDPRPAATASASRIANDGTVHGMHYVQNAVTAAYSKALTYLGFGTPLDAHVTDGQLTASPENCPERTETGVDVPPMVVPEKEEKDAVQPKAKRGRPKKNAEESKPAEKNAEEGIPVVNPPEVNLEEEPEKEEPAKKEPTALPSFEEACNVVFPFSKAKGLTIDEACQKEGATFIRWMYDKRRPSAPNDSFTLALGVYCEFKGC